MSRICVVGGLTAAGLAAAALQKLGQSLAVAAEEVSNFTLTAEGFHIWEPPKGRTQPPITYGPPRRGKGGKIRRW